MNKGGGLAYRICLGLLLLWPIVHAVLSRVGRFSPWRFAGWGMYATVYPSSRQKPIIVVARQSPGDQLSPAPVFHSGEDRTEELSRAGVSFLAVNDGRPVQPLTLPEAGGARAVASLAKAVRQMNTADNLVGLHELLQSGASAGWPLLLGVGEQRARVIDNHYGVDFTFYSVGFDGSLNRVGSAGPVSLFGRVGTASN